MAWTPKNPTGKCPMKEETIAALGNTATVYTSVIDFIDPILRNGQTTKYLVFTFQPSDTPASGDYEIILYGAKKSGGTKVLLLDALIADTKAILSGKVDISQYPYPYYYVGIKSAGNDAAKSGIVTITGDIG